MAKARDSSPRAEELAFITWTLDGMMGVGLSPLCCIPASLKTVVWEIMTEADDFQPNL